MPSKNQKPKTPHYASKPYTQIPDGLWFSKDFNRMSPYSRCIYMLMLGKWDQFKPDKEFPFPYDEIQQVTKFNRSTISKSIKELWVAGFIDIPHKGKYPKNISLYK